MDQDIDIAGMQHLIEWQEAQLKVKDAALKLMAEKILLLEDKLDDLKDDKRERMIQIDRLG